MLLPGADAVNTPMRYVNNNEHNVKEKQKQKNYFVVILPQFNLAVAFGDPLHVLHTEIRISMYRGQRSALRSWEIIAPTVRTVLEDKEPWPIQLSLTRGCEGFQNDYQAVSRREIGFTG